MASPQALSCGAALALLLACAAPVDWRLALLATCLPVGWLLTRGRGRERNTGARGAALCHLLRSRVIRPHAAARHTDRLAQEPASPSEAEELDADSDSSVSERDRDDDALSAQIRRRSPSGAAPHSAVVPPDASAPSSPPGAGGNAVGRAAPTLAEGSRVLLRGLRGRPELNGEAATVVGAAPPSADAQPRALVRLERDVRAHVLRPAAAAGARPPPLAVRVCNLERDAAQAGCLNGCLEEDFGMAR
jgi:hypothetical protein